MINMFKHFFLHFPNNQKYFHYLVSFLPFLPALLRSAVEMLVETTLGLGVVTAATEMCSLDGVGTMG